MISNGNGYDMAPDVAAASREDGRPAPAIGLSRWRDGGSANKVQMEGFGEC